MNKLDTPLAQLKALIGQVQNLYDRRSLEQWVEKHVHESTTEISLTKEAVMYAKDSLDDMIKHYERRVYESVGEQVLKDCGTKEVRETPHGMSIRYYFYALTKDKK